MKTHEHLEQKTVEAWPELRYEAWSETKETVHRWTQIVGKVRLALSPRLNHWWQVPLYVGSRGLTTSPIPYKGGLFEATFDFTRHELLLDTSWGDSADIPLGARSVADFHEEFFDALERIGVSVEIWPVPVEIPDDKTPFTQDRRHASYDEAAIEKLWRLLLSAHGVLSRMRCDFLGKQSPVHFFWGSFDLAYTRFSGRRAPPRQGADPITAEAYSHEVWSAGWWPGGLWPGASGPLDAMFYAYASPEPKGFAQALVRPASAGYRADLKEFSLDYETARKTADPDALLRQFAESTYAAAADLGDWDRSGLERLSKDAPAPASPPRSRSRS